MSGLISVADLRVTFQARAGLRRSAPARAVDGVTLEVGAGETVAVVGESGSGKTTLGRAMLRLLRPSGGKVVFDGREITGIPDGRLKEFRRRAQAVFQDPYTSVSPYMTVGEIVEEPLLIHGVKPRKVRTERVLQALDQVNLIPGTAIAAKYPHNLSGGQRQRVCIARAIILEPDFVVADEPVSMVDASNRAEILNLLVGLQKRRGIAFLYITHDIASARYFSDRVAVMYAGTLVEVGPTDQVIDGPTHPYTRGLLAAVPEPDPENRRHLRSVIPGEAPSATDVPSGCPFHPRCDRVIAGRCEANRPTMRRVGPEVEVACHLYDGTTHSISMA